MKEIKQNKILNEFLTNRGNLIEFVIVAIIIGIGINFLSSSIYSMVSICNKDLYFIFTGLILCLLSILFFFNKFFGVKKTHKTITGFLIIDKDINEIVHIDNYDFARTLTRNLKAAITEDKAIKMDWENSSFKYDATQEKKKKGQKIISELTEYYVLETMSTHLTDFFNLNNIDKEQLVELERNDIPSILLNNQFLELFSKPMDRRASFKKTENENSKPAGKVVASFSNGAIFQHFDFVLPKNSQITKDKNGYIEIKTKRLTLKYKTFFAGMGTVSPLGYEEHYLNLTDRKKFSTYRVDIELEFEIHFGTLLLKNGWNYYNWVDSLLEKLENKISKSAYFDRIDWDKAFVIIKTTKDRNSNPISTMN